MCKAEEIQGGEQESLAFPAEEADPLPRECFSLLHMISTLTEPLTDAAVREIYMNRRCVKNGRQSHIDSEEKDAFPRPNLFQYETLPLSSLLD